jgi:1,4-alpha-glucan branching enzyme
MEFRYAISLIFEAHLPFVREYRKDDDLSQAGEEDRFLQFVSETLIPLLEVLHKLENDNIPFRLAIAVSPILCHMLNDEHLQKKYLHYIDKQIEFGRQELERTAGNDVLNKLVKNYYNKIVDRRIAYTERYDKNLLKAIDYFRRKGKIEILASCATHAFLPFISHNHESLQAQMEVPIQAYRRHFGGTPQGFWLPSLGWTPELESFLTAYNYTFTILDTHGLLFGNPTPEKGCFYPIKTPAGTFILGRDRYAIREIRKIAADELYRNNDRDAGYELPVEIISPFLSTEGERHRTGYNYWSNMANGKTNSQAEIENESGINIYNPQAASKRVIEHAKTFLENTTARLEDASKYMNEAPISISAHNAANFGSYWYEGPQFIEALFKAAAQYNDLKFICPSEYIYRQDISSFQVVSPEFSSSGVNGYAETWLDVSNDWIYRHLSRAMERMTELAERFPDDTGLKERALNQAAREILLAQSSDWPTLLHRQESKEYAHKKAENALRNFTTIYEALGSNYISTEWLTTLERKHNIFPNINYRVFRRKK